MQALVYFTNMEKITTSQAEQGAETMTTVQTCRRVVKMAEAEGDTATAAIWNHRADNFEAGIVDPEALRDVQYLTVGNISFSKWQKAHRLS